MFCKNCGEKNTDGAKFCTSCGYNFDEPLAHKRKSTKGNAEKASSKHLLKIPVISILSILAVFFGLYQVGLNVTKPEKVVEKYITALANANYDAIYDSLDIVSDTFTSKEQFISTLTYPIDMSENKVTSLNILPAMAKDLEDIDPPLGGKIDAAYKAVYTTLIDPEPFTEIVMLIKKGKVFGIFDKYKIEPSKFIAQEYKIIAPVGIKVYFDEIELDDTFITETNIPQKYRDSENPFEENIYTISKTFSGEHIITAVSDFTEKYEAPVYVQSNNTEDLKLYGFTIKADIRSRMREITENTLKVFVNGMVTEKSFDEISNQINIVPVQTNEIEKFYSYFLNGNWSGYDNRGVIYKNLSITDIMDETEDGLDNRLTGRTKSPLSYTLTYIVTCDVEPREGYILLGERHFEMRRNMNIDFSYEDGDLKIYSIGW